MTKEQLLETVLSNLLAFEKSCADTNTSRFVTEFESFFRKHENGVGLKTAIIQATGASPLESGIVRKYLSSLPGIKLNVAGSKEVLCISVAEVSTALESPPTERGNPPPAETKGETDDLSDWIVPAEFAKEYEEAVKFIKVHRTWTDNIDIMNEIQRKLNWIKQVVPGRWQSMKDIAEDGKRIAEIIDKAGDRKKRPDMNTQAQWFDELQRVGASEQDLDKFENALTVRQIARSSRVGGQRKSATPGLAAPDFDVKAPNPFALRNLLPSRNWTVLIDETGKLFDVKAVGTGTVDEPLRGKVVALLVPEGSSLPRLSGGDHATKDTKDDVESRLEKVLSTHPRCGILGVTLEGLPKVHSAAVNYWYTAIERCFDLVLRLTKPASTGKTFFKFLVEARTDAPLLDSQNRMVERTLHSSLCRFARANPSLDAKIDASVSVELKSKPVDKNFISKPVDRDFIAYNGYVDAIANAWNGERDVLKADLKAYGLPGRCLLSGETQNLTATMDALDAGDPVSAEQWSELLSLTRKDGPDSLPAVTLGKFAERVKKDERLWTDLVRDTKLRLDSHDVRLRDLRARIEWLENNKPDGARLPKRLELLWLVVRLANANHHGATEAQLKDAKIDMARFRRLVDELFEEDAPLVSWATLHLAVLATDSFEFAKARRIVRDFLALAAKKQAERGFFARIKERLAGIPSDPVLAANPAVMGLRYHSELISSLGQHAAFEGDNTTAVKLFRQAIEGFARLSEEKLRMKEIGKTRAYLATAAMDAKDVSDDELRQIVRDYLGKDPVEAASKLSSSEDVKDYYCHHILLRYIVSGRAPVEVGTNYLAEKRNWAHVLDGHPWELIEFYRSILVDDPTEKTDLLHRATANCRDRGLTLQVIGCVILNALAPLDSSVIDEYRRNLAEIREGLPSLGAKRLTALEKAAESPVDPLKLARTVLPFNFR